MAFKRKQIYLDPANDRALRTLARKTGLSQAEHIRRAITAYLEWARESGLLARSPNPLLRLIGICDSPKGRRDTALHHDRYLYGRRP
ncbi:MAG: CopG family transcriptional regulator [Deltaproteobacteria bacterium]|nr:CopG family transcriptional regulator [Deltaproteobacteria bacterium]